MELTVRCRHVEVHQDTYGTSLARTVVLSISAEPIVLYRFVSLFVPLLTFYSCLQLHPQWQDVSSSLVAESEDLKLGTYWSLICDEERKE
jgi:hypothetical protein